MSYNTILVNRENGIATITLNRPPMNPLNSELFKEFSNAIDELAEDASVKVLVITGAGSKAFAAGADVSEMAYLSPVEVYGFNMVSRTAFDKVENLGKPAIAALAGITFGGGCELALACDFRFAAENTKIAFPETGLGIIPGGGGTVRLPKLIGASKAKELIYAGDIIDAATAEKLGIVNKVVPVELLMDETLKFAAKLAAKPAVAMKMAKESINVGANLDTGSALYYENQCFITAFASADAKEGLGAFLEKRKPNYTGK
jgi:enoyl-CoA hydratase